jgi:predicted GH43/DUF377 family glycosyl hydrolase
MNSTRWPEFTTPAAVVGFLKKSFARLQSRFSFRNLGFPAVRQTNSGSGQPTIPLASVDSRGSVHGSFLIPQSPASEHAMRISEGQAVRMYRSKCAIFVVLALLTSRVATALAAEPTTQKTAYLAAYFCEKKNSDGSENSQLYYAISKDGFRFAYAVNHNQPILAATMDDKLIRDPTVMRGPDGVFHMVATVSWKNRPFTLWDSKDLVHWENERLVDCAPPGASKTWAPDLLWDPDTKQYVVFWTAEVNHDWNTACIWYATSRDLKQFSEPKVLMREKGGCLDADIINCKGKWYMVYRYNGIWIRSADKALGPYENPVKALDLDVEGPFLFPVNGQDDKLAMVFDYFGGNQGRWGLATSSDMQNWTLVSHEKWPYYHSDFYMPLGVRHGSVLPITAEESERILNAFGADQWGPDGQLP